MGLQITRSPKRAMDWDRTVAGGLVVPVTAESKPRGRLELGVALGRHQPSDFVLSVGVTRQLGLSPLSLSRWLASL